jgi:hypothetical protein
MLYVFVVHPLDVELEVKNGSSKLTETECEIPTLTPKTFAELPLDPEVVPVTVVVAPVIEPGLVEVSHVIVNETSPEIV